MVWFLDAMASAGHNMQSKQSAPRSRQTPTPHHLIFTDRMLFLAPNQQCQSAEGITMEWKV